MWRWELHVERLKRYGPGHHELMGRKEDVWQRWRRVKEGGMVGGGVGRVGVGGAPCWFSVHVTEWQVEGVGPMYMCVCVSPSECKQRRAGPWGRGVHLFHSCPDRYNPSPSASDPTPQLNHRYTQSLRSAPKVSFIPSQGSIWSAQPPYAPVCGWMCGSLKIPICCPWLDARRAGNGRLCCRKYRGLLRLCFLVEFHAQG